MPPSKADQDLEAKIQRVMRGDPIDGSKPPASPPLVKADERSLYDVVSSTGEIVGSHEDLGVATSEAERLDIEARVHFQQAVATTPGLEPVEHRVERRVIIATDDPDDGMAPLDGPIVSDGNVTLRNLERGDKSDEPVQVIG